MIEHAFGLSEPWSIGLEEEIMILDAATLELAPGVGTLLREAEGVELPGLLKTELFASVVELNTRPCATASEAIEHLAELRRAAARLAGSNGLALAAAGSHPFSRPEGQQVAAEARYLDFVEYAGVSAMRQGVCGLHVHVGMPSPAACFVALEGVLPWLPLLLALSANSPYLAGRETGLASTRAEVLALLPRSGAPPAFASYEDWEAFVERLVRLGVAEDYTRFWWDVRFHPRFGTLEVRMPDQPTALAQTGALTALVLALCVSVLRDPPRTYDPSARGIYRQNRWSALRFGAAAELVHPDGERRVPVPELTEELLALVAPAVRELGLEELLEPLDPVRSEGERQLEVGRADGTAAAAADLVVRSVASAS